MKTLLAIFLGGGLGSLVRYGISTVCFRYFPFSFPFSTMISNIISCTILGLILGYASLRPGQEIPYRNFIIIGFCGGFSTFSSFTAETFELIRHGSYLYTGINVAGNLMLCMTALIFGIWFTRMLLS